MVHKLSMTIYERKGGGEKGGLHVSFIGTEPMNKLKKKNRKNRYFVGFWILRIFWYQKWFSREMRKLLIQMQCTVHIFFLWIRKLWIWNLWRIYKAFRLVEFLHQAWGKQTLSLAEMNHVIHFGQWQVCLPWVCAGVLHVESPYNLYLYFTYIVPYYISLI